MSTTAPTIPLQAGIKPITLVVQSNNNDAQTKLLPSAHPNNSRFLNSLIRFFDVLSSGVWSSNINVVTGGVYATGTATLASVVNTDTIVIGGVTLTATSGTATATQFKVGASNTATAASLAAAINADTRMNKVVQATSVGAVVTIACIYPGTIGNLVTLSQTGGHITVGAALTGGTDGVLGNISHGL